MSHHVWRISACWIVTLTLIAGLLGACVTSETEVRAVPAAPATQVVAYPGGQYRLYGSGTTASPSYWVWIPAVASAPAPPASTTSPTVAFPAGRYQLYGSGMAQRSNRGELPHPGAEHHSASGKDRQ